MFIDLSLILLSLLTQVESKSNLLEKINWLNFNYDQLHEYAIQDQVDNYQPLFKYTHSGADRSLNGLYNFCFDSSLEGFKGEWFNKDLRETCSKENFFRMPVPSAFNDITSTSKAKNYVGWVWYQAIFEIQNSEANFDLFIRFENINYMAAVWIQEKAIIDGRDVERRASFLGVHVGGYLPFAFKIPAGNKFRLTIAVSNMLTQDTIPSGKMIDLSKQAGYNLHKFQPDFDFFHFAGIMGNILLSKRSPHFFFKDTEKIHHNGTIITRLTICFNEDRQTDTDVFLKVDYFNTDTRSIVDSERALIEVGKCLKFPSPIQFESLEKNRLLSIKSMRFRLEYRRSESDFVEIPVRFQADYLNGTFDTKFTRSLHHKQSSPFPDYLQGFGMHHEQLFSGRTMSLSSIMKDMYLLKEVGANVIRTSHYPYSSEYLEACDELGIKVIAECQAVGLNTFSDLKLMLHKQLLLEMMQRDDHHSSIIMWSVANEPQSNLPAAKGYFESLLKYARKELAKYTVDSGRPLTAAIAQSHLDDKIGHTLDIIMINRYYGWYDYTGVIEAIRLPLIKSLEGWSSVYPTSGLIVSEFGADTVSGLHSVTRGDLFSEEYQRDLLVEYEKVFNEIVCNYIGKINLLGSMIWNFADFSTHESLLRVGGNRKGVFNRDRSPKLAVEAVRNIYQRRLNKSCLYEISEGAYCGS